MGWWWVAVACREGGVGGGWGRVGRRIRSGLSRTVKRSKGVREDGCSGEGGTIMSGAREGELDKKGVREEVARGGTARGGGGGRGRRKQGSTG